MTTASTDTGLTADEHAIYDRQLRVWGVDAQQRIRCTHVLLLSLNGLAIEVVKNIVLAGIGKLTIYDYNTPVQQIDYATNFFLEGENEEKKVSSRAEASLSNIRSLNPHTHVEVINTLPTDYTQYTAVCMFNLPLSESLNVANKIRSQKSTKNGNEETQIFISGLYGWYGWMIEDLGQIYRYSTTAAAASTANADTTTTTTPPQPKHHEITYPTIQHVIDLPWSNLPKLWGKRDKIHPLLAAIVTALRFDENQEKADGTDERNGVTAEDKNADDEDQINARLLKLRDELCADNNVSSTFISDTLQLQLYSQRNALSSPLCSILGGMVGQEILQTVSHKEAPLNNVMLYNGVTGMAIAKPVK